MLPPPYISVCVCQSVSQCVTLFVLPHIEHIQNIITSQFIPTPLDYIGPATRMMSVQQQDNLTKLNLFRARWTSIFIASSLEVIKLSTFILAFAISSFLIINSGEVTFVYWKKKNMQDVPLSILDHIISMCIH